ncbi:MAG TPA: sugar transferase [Flavobacteriales bacterium]|nr:sugar transferase [Flavobacteriales bacterium]
MKRVFDILCSFTGLIILSPFLILISMAVALTSRGGVFFSQVRVGKNNRDFYLYKFRTMRMGSEQKGQLTVGSRDSRITRVGYFLRKFKLDELPQLFNVLLGDMSLVGPRPEVRKYVDLYTEEQKKVLRVRPGITDYASLEYFEESDLLAKSANPEKTYVDLIMPEKLRINLGYIDKASLGEDLKIIFKTLGRILLGRRASSTKKTG